MKNSHQLQKLLRGLAINSRNPFPEIVKLFSTTPTLLTLPVMDQVRSILETSGITLTKYAQVYEVINYLSENKALSISEQADGSYMITNPYGQ